MTRRGEAGPKGLRQKGSFGKELSAVRRTEDCILPQAKCTKYTRGATGKDGGGEPPPYAGPCPSGSGFRRGRRPRRPACSAGKTLSDGAPGRRALHPRSKGRGYLADDPPKAAGPTCASELYPVGAAPCGRPNETGCSPGFAPHISAAPKYNPQSPPSAATAPFQRSLSGGLWKAISREESNAGPANAAKENC